MRNYKIEKILNGRLAEFCYLVHDIDSKDCICVDPGYDTDRILKFINQGGYIIKYILLTHGHFDHIFDAKKLKETEPIGKGLGASPGAATGRVVFTAEDAVNWAEK